ncbi:hypothetical protein F4861DRAFT_533806 [Xylaria intraflava]|nr:hypothetical protein F4861DRAFT_533806 [Xylaria intraflava]
MEVPPGVDIWTTPASKAPPGYTTDFNSTDTSAPVFYGVSSTFLALAVICVALKLYIRILVHRKLGLDDACSVIALLLQTSYTALVDFMFIRGGARHQWDMPLGLFLWIHQIQTHLAVIQMLAYLFTKLAILILYYRVFSPKPLFRWAILGGCAVVIPIYIAFFFIYIFGKTIQILVPTSYAVAIVNLITDVYLFLLPMFAIGSLNLPTVRKFGAAGIFAAGALACALSSLGVYYRFGTIAGIAAIDTTYTFSPRTAVLVVEIYIGIIVGCLPLFPGLLRKTVLTKFFASTYKSLRDRLNPSTVSKSSSQSTYLDDSLPLSSYKKTQSVESHRDELERHYADPEMQGRRS